jgi:phenylpropionate dioxygenase-like ring-hydroxylating dioxygenase large terminal subunit
MHLASTADYGALVMDDAVHGDVYLRQDVFEAEMGRIFGAGWVYVGHESEVPNRGDFKRSWLGVQALILCRDDNGAVQVLFNRCRHRAASICQLDTGNASVFRCEYHGWTYRLNGELVAVPYADAYGDQFNRADFPLGRPPRVDAYRGFVFASMNPQVEALYSALGEPARRQIDYFCDLSPVGRVRLQAGAAKLAFDCNWKLQMENSIDGYHPNFTHQSFFAGIQRATGVRVDTFDGTSTAECRALGNGHTLLDYSRPNLASPNSDRRLAALQSTAWGRQYFGDMVQVYGAERAREVLLVGGTHMSVFPNLVVLGQQVRTIRPVRSERTEVYLAPALLEGVPDELNTQRLRQFEAFYSPHGGGIHDDIEMFNRVAEGLRCGADPWLLFRRGVHRERVDTDGTRVGQITDEVSQRAMWRHWKLLMSAGVAA